MGKFLTKSGGDGQFYFTLVADNAQVVLSSEGYTTSAAMENGIASVRTNATDDARYELLTASNGKLYFNLKAGNGQVIGTSQMYADESGRTTGIASLKANAPAATVESE